LLVGDAESDQTPTIRQLSRRQRALRLATTLGVILLALTLILGSISSVRDTVTSRLFPPAPKPDPRVARFPYTTNQFAFIPNVPWGTVLLDGHPLAHPPLAGDPHPLRLAGGHHQLIWRAAPFLDLTCAISAPHAASDTCPLVDPLSVSERLPAALRPPASQAAIIGLHDSLAELPQDQSAALLTAIQIGLDGAHSSVIVQPGEQYFYYIQGQSGGPVTANQALRATLSFEMLSFVDAGGLQEPCIIMRNVRPCWFPAQDCRSLCTIPSPPAGSNAGWLAAALVSPSWAYTTLDGHPVASNLGERGFNINLAALRISWDGVNWHATPIFGHQTGIPVADDATCAPGLDWLSQGPLQGIFSGDLPLMLQYAAATAPADGCALVVTPLPGAAQLPSTPASPAIFLERFGVLLSANDSAHTLWPDISVADADEQHEAAQLAAQLSA
jgi:hypothetical protein